MINPRVDMCGQSFAAVLGLLRSVNGAVVVGLGER